MAHSAWRRVWIALGITAALAVVAACVQISQINARNSYMTRAMGTLRSIGSSELAYQSGNRWKAYGSFKALSESSDCASGYTLGNMIEKYSMTWRVRNDESHYNGPLPLPAGLINTFTVITWPCYSERNWRLSTFAITEDQSVRTFVFENGNRLDAVHTWDPVL